MFENERGRNQMALVDDPLTRRGCELWLDRVLSYYGPDGGVDVEVIGDQIILNQQTVDYLYSQYTPLDLHYTDGSRPMLEAVVDSCLSDDMSERAKALALMRRVRDNQDMGLARASLFSGGSEEDLLKRGAVMCNEVSRLYVCLCQIAGLPARLHGAHISGHMMAEVLTDGKWGWVDPMKGLAAVLDDDTPASVWDLKGDPKLFERQPQRVWDDCRPPSIMFGSEQRDPRNIAFTMAKNRDCYFHRREAVALGNYFVWDFARYTYLWRIEAHDPVALSEARHGEQLNRKAAGWPDLYYDWYLFDEKLSVRGQ